LRENSGYVSNRQENHRLLWEKRECIGFLNSFSFSEKSKNRSMGRDKKRKEEKRLKFNSKTHSANKLENNSSINNA
jgi:hypothetical protein